jgi:hypothetical protein
MDAPMIRVCLGRAPLVFGEAPRLRALPSSDPLDEAGLDVLVEMRATLEAVMAHPAMALLGVDGGEWLAARLVEIDRTARSRMPKRAVRIVWAGPYKTLVFMAVPLASSLKLPNGERLAREPAERARALARHGSTCVIEWGDKRAPSRCSCVSGRMCVNCVLRLRQSEGRP